MKAILLSTRAARPAACLLAVVVSASSAWAQAQPGVAKLTDPNTVFHRLYVVGAGHNRSEDLNMTDDWIEVREDLEGERGRNQADGSTSTTLFSPTKDELKKELERLKQLAQPGEEVTFYYNGHGGGGPEYGLQNSVPGSDERYDEFIQIGRTFEFVTDDELATMLKGFREGVTLVVLMSTCFGGGFTGTPDDIQESTSVAVIGVSTLCPIDKAHGFGVTIGETEVLSGNSFVVQFVTAALSGFGATVETLSEDMADGAGEKEADGNGDGVVTADELKKWLTDEGWNLGPPDDGCSTGSCAPKDGSSLCADPAGRPCDLPDVAIDPDGAREGHLPVRGMGFSADSDVRLELTTGDGTPVSSAGTRTDASGGFRAHLPISGVEPQTFALGAIDAAGFHDHLFVEVTGAGDDEEQDRADRGGLAGDGDGDGDVDGADYIVWRANFGTTATEGQAAVPGDYNGDGMVDANDYVVWRSSFHGEEALGMDDGSVGAASDERVNVTGEVIPPGALINYTAIQGPPILPGIQDGGIELRRGLAVSLGSDAGHLVRGTASRAGRGADDPGSLLDGPMIYIESLGGSTGEVVKVHIVNPDPEPLTLEGYVAVEPVQIPPDQREKILEQIRRAPGAHQEMNANFYCLEFLRAAPPQGIVYRIAGAAKQERFASAARALESARRLQEAGRLSPDTNPESYFHSIRQWGVWTLEQGFDREKFLDAFLEHAKKNFARAGREWSDQVEAAVRRSAEGRWEDVAEVLAEAP